MQLTRTDEKFYPRLFHYLKNEVPKLIQNIKIAKALLKYGQIKKSTLSQVLGYGSGPFVKVAPIMGACGEFSPGVNSNELRVNASLVARFEQNPNDRVLLQTLGATILHELVHWGDDQDGQDYPGEEGELFEKHVYQLAQHHCSHFYPSLIKKGIVF